LDAGSDQNRLEKKYWNSSTRYLTVGGTKLRIRVSGNPQAPPIVFLHGFASSLETWEPWAAVLSGRYRVVRFDLPGAGLSEPDNGGDYSDVRSLSLVKELLDALEIDTAVVVGNSLGGRIAWRFAAMYPGRVSKLVLISPDGFASPGFQYGQAPYTPAVVKLMKYFLPRPLVRMNLATAYGDPGRLTEAVVDRYYDLLLAPGNRGATIDRMHQTILVEPIALLRSITVPTLLLWGQQDRLIPYANAADYQGALPNATLVSFPELGHVPHEESPLEALRPMQQFLAR